MELEDEIHARRELEEGDLGSKLDTEDPFGEDPGSVKVLVNEDYLFEVDVRARELAPVYWLGNIYEVRRGTWFIQGKSSTSLLSTRLINSRWKLFKALRRESCYSDRRGISSTKALPTECSNWRCHRPERRCSSQSFSASTNMASLWPIHERLCRLCRFSNRLASE